MAQKIHKRTYSFPRLTAETIVRDLGELGINVTTKDLDNPTAELVRGIFEQLIPNVMGANPESAPEFQGLEHLHQPQLHEQSLPEIAFLKQKLRLMKAVDCPATIRDFIFPNRTRLRLMLAAIINFVRFAAEREGTYDELSGATIELLEQRQALAEEHRSRAKRAKALRAHREAALPQIQELQQQIADLEKEIATAKKHERETENDIAAARKNLQETDDSIDNDALSILHARESVKKWEVQVVRDPAELKRSLFEMSNRIAAEKEEVARANQSLVALQAQRKVLERLATRIEAANAQMEDIGSIVQKTSDSKDQAQDRKHKIALVVQDTKNEAVARERLDRDIDASQKKLFELKQQYEIKRQQVEQTLEELRRSKRKRQMIATKHAAQALQNESQCEELERKISEQEEEHQRIMRSLTEEFSNLNLSLRAYHDRIRVHLC